MKFADFANMAFSENGTVRFFVFDDDDIRDDFRAGGDNEPLFVIETQFEMRYVLHERFSEAEVSHFYAHGEDEVDVIICEDGGAENEHE